MVFTFLLYKLGKTENLLTLMNFYFTLVYFSLDLKPHRLTEVGWESSWVDYLKGALYKTAIIRIRIKCCPL